MLWFLRKKTSPSSSAVWVTAGVVLLLKSLFILLTSIRGLASISWLIDDSFIEMKVAQNLGLGLGFSLDGIHSTTGAPFFWIYLTSLNHMVFGQDAAIRATLIESALLGALATIVVFHIALKLTEDRRVAWTAFLLSTFSLSPFLNAMNGMDTAIFTLFVMLAIAASLDVGKPARWSAFSWGCVVGLMGGLAVMTRGDGIFVLGSIVCLKLYEWHVASGKEKKERVQSLLGMLLVAGICFSMFMGWQLVQTGSPFPGNQVGRRGLALAWHNFSFDDFSLPRYLQIVAWNIFQLEELLTIVTGGSLLMLAALCSGALHKRMRSLAIISILYLGVFFALLVGYQWYFANVHGIRYINPAAHILFIFAAFLFWRLPAERWRTVVAVFLTIATLVIADYKFYQMISRLPWTPYMSFVGRPDPAKAAQFWGTMDWMKENLPPDTIVGIRDYGRPSMFAGVRIQDLAGNIDPAVAVALNDGTLDAYLKEKNVTYLLIPSLDQRSDVLYQYLHKNLRLELVKEAPVSPTQHLYKIMW